MMPASPIDVPGIASLQQRLNSIVRSMNRVVVAFSAGVDSTLVLKVALDVLGREHVLAATGVSPSLPARELDQVKRLADVLGAPLELINTSEMEDARYAANPNNRCYFCKNELYTRLTALAREKGCDVVANGINVDDQGDWRPGLKAAKEWNVRAPLLEAGLNKGDVRELAKQLDLPNWEKPALACLSSRIPYGTPVTIGALSRIEKAEAFLWERGFVNFRVRHHSNLARVEVAREDLHRLLEEPLRGELIAHFKGVGYTYVTVDLQGFRSGSGNEVLGGAGGE